MWFVRQDWKFYPIWIEVYSDFQNWHWNSLPLTSFLITYYLASPQILSNLPCNSSSYSLPLYFGLDLYFFIKILQAHFTDSFLSQFEVLPYFALDQSKPSQHKHFCLHWLLLLCHYNYANPFHSKATYLTSLLLLNTEVVNQYFMFGIISCSFFTQ